MAESLDQSGSAAARPAWFRWYVCALLLMATTINYMDRQTLSSMNVRISEELELSQKQYGTLEMGFAYAFAAGAIAFGVLADVMSIRWLYAGVLVAWSLVGIATGSARDYDDLLVCRTLLGFFEAGHWPCALRTTRLIMSQRERTLGNSILQSGSSIGAILTPLIILAMLTPEPGSWRFPFQVIGAIGLIWAVFWVTALRGFNWKDEEPSVAAPPPAEVEATPPPAENESPPAIDTVWDAYRPPAAPAEEAPATTSLSTNSFIRRIIVLLIVVTAINICWQLFRAWLPRYLEKGRGYSESFALGFTSVYYVATDVGCILAGWATVALAARGWRIGVSRWIVFFVCSLLAALALGVAITPAGPLLLVQLCLLGAGALGLFLCYYSLSQEVSGKHQGKITGFLGCAAWVTSAPVHPYFGAYIDRTESYDLGLAIAGTLPLVAAIAWLLIWDWRTETR